MESTDNDQIYCEKVLSETSSQLMNRTILTCERNIKGMDLKMQVLQQRLQTEMVGDRLVDFHNIIEAKSDKLKRIEKTRKERKLNNYRQFQEVHITESTDQPDTISWEKRCVKGDGNCLFRSLSVGIYGSEEYHEVVREEIVSHMQTHGKEFREIVDGSFNKHMHEMGTTHGRLASWGTEAEIYAAATLLGAPIWVKKISRDSTEWLQFEPQKDIANKLSAKYKISLEYKSNHYNALIAKMVDIEQASQSENMRAKHQIEVDNGIDTNKDTKQPEMSKAPSDSRRNAKEQTHIGDSKYEKKPSQQRKYQEKTIFNQSKRVLSDAEVSLLSKGLSFVPTKKRIDMTNLLADIREWERRMRLKEYFYNTEQGDQLPKDEIQKDQQWQKAGTKKSDWVPPQGRDKWLDMYIDLVRDDIIKGLKKDVQNNITVAEETAIKALLTDNSIVIRPVDKGSGVVIMDTGRK
jgi:hypothetical protein